jgi:chemotaxis protein MotB
MAKPEGQPIIKRVKKAGHGGAHGGVWKLAYADFVTAMMAFFLLMWLLNVTSEEMKSGLAQYFSPESVSPSPSGSGDIFFGLTIAVDQPQQAQSKGSAVLIPIPEANRAGSGGKAIGDAPAQSGEDAADAAGSKESSKGSSEADEVARKDGSEREAREQLADQLAAQIREVVSKEKPSGVTMDNISVTVTPTGIAIEIIDTPKASMFEIGRSVPLPETVRILQTIAGVIRDRGEALMIVGHTDGRQYAEARSYSNWELGSDRANAARRVLVAAGIDPVRMSKVSSVADRELKVAADPLAAENRRVQIQILK